MSEVTFIDEIEEKIGTLLGKSAGEWISVAEMIKEVETGELWRNGGSRSFTIWVRGLARTAGVSLVSIWRIYRALEVLKRLQGEILCDSQISAQEILAERPWINVTGLYTLSAIEKERIETRYIARLKEEYVKGTLSASDLGGIKAEIDRCKRAGIKHFGALLTLRKTDISEIIGRKGERFKLLTDLPKETGLDGIAVIKNRDDLELVAIFIDRYEKSALDEAFDWLLLFRTETGTLFGKEDGVIDLDLATGQFHIVLSARKQKSTPLVRLQLSQKIMARLLFGGAKGGEPLPIGADEENSEI